MVKNANTGSNQKRKNNREIIVLAHNIRSTHNIGAIFRTSEGFGVNKIILSGYSPFPKTKNESAHTTNRLPYLAEKINNQIHKTALGAEEIVHFEVSKSITETIFQLKNKDYKIIALEQTENSIKLPDFRLSNNSKIALLLGEEVNGIVDEILTQTDFALEIPMFGQKESFNVSVAAGIALYKIACE